MNLDDYFLHTTTSGSWYHPSSENNSVTPFYDNKLFFKSILDDMATATDESHFIYIAGWWTDIDIPLGDPHAPVVPPSLRMKLTELAAGKPEPPPGGIGPVAPNKPGPQICSIIWEQKKQMDIQTAALLAIKSLNPQLPPSLFGKPNIAPINKKCVDFVNSLQGHNKGILDNATTMFGCHHQKIVIILNQTGLVAYVGSSDFNADRLYAIGDGSANSRSTTNGSPLNDVNLRITGRAAADVLTGFVKRWNATDEGKQSQLKGESYISDPNSAKEKGNVTMQVTHTYASGYPSPFLVRTAADARLKLIRSATQYIYIEDQYLIGCQDLKNELKAKLSDEKNKDLVVICVMSPAIISDLPFVEWRRSYFWYELYKTFGSGPNRRLLLFEMKNDECQNNGVGSYLHNKMVLVDDQVGTLGSVNFSQRSSTHDSEISVTFGSQVGNAPVDVSNPNIIADIRRKRWEKHLGVDDMSKMPLQAALAVWKSLPGQKNRVSPYFPSETDPLLVWWKYGNHPAIDDSSVIAYSNRQLLYDKILDPT